MTVKELRLKLASCPDEGLIATGEPAAQGEVRLINVTDGPDYVVIRSNLTAPHEWETPSPLQRAKRSAIL